jgi:hypothetical protein
VISKLKRILINASNLHGGGAVQVATSFILELSNSCESLTSYEFFIYASSVVDSNLISSGFKREKIKNYQIFNIYGLQGLKWNLAERFYGYDLIFTIFGPLYLPKFVKNHIMGFAQPWIIYPNNDVVAKISFYSIILLRIKFYIQWRFFQRASRLVVELEHVRNRLVSFKNYPLDRVDVVYNCISALYYDSKFWLPLPTIKELSYTGINLGFLTKDYPHKNIIFLLKVKRELKLISNINFNFFVTLDEVQWNKYSNEFKDQIFNIGPLNVAQCPSFYKSMDGVIFPSLLECFSASPLEAMAMRRPLFASEREFVRDCCGDNAIYFDPLNPNQTAKIIYNWFCLIDSQSRVNHIDRAYQHVMSLNDSRNRAQAYIDIINKQLID